MPRVTLDPTTPRFLVDGEPRFLLADTVWSAFHRPTPQEWRSYLRLRRRQGFNALNISVLSIAHDRSSTDGDLGTDWPHARAMCEEAIAHGLVPILIVLWCNYVPGTWGAALTPDLVLTAEETDAHVDRVVDTFADLGVIFSASGDENFSDPRSVERYGRVLRRLRERAPDNLLTLHPAPFVTQPETLTDLIDFAAYQAGHDDEWATQPAVGAAALTELGKPVVSMEPCYEGHGYGKGAGRHTAADVRLASWVSVLAGSGAGLGYGAHGVWSWHRQGEPFTGEHFSGTPFPADVALRFDGAWDMGLLRRLVERHGLHDLRLRPELLIDDRSGAYVATQENPRRVALYLPHPFAVTLDADLSGWQVESWNLGARNPDHPVLRFEDGRTVVEQPEFLSDSLYVFRA